jgi:hypothetical protein
VVGIGVSEVYNLPLVLKGGVPPDGLGKLPPGKKPKRSFRISPKLLAFEILTFTVFALLFAAGFLAWRLQQGPIDLSSFRGEIERSLTDARGGKPVKFDGVALEWVRERNKVEAVVRNFKALDEKGATVFQSERASIAISAASLLSGKLKTTGIRLDNGQAKVIRSKDGVWSLADLVIAREPSSDKPFDPFKDLKWETLATPIRALISAGSFERVEISNFKLTVEDRKSNAVWSASPVVGVWSASAEGVALDLSVKLAEAVRPTGDEPNSIVVSLASDGAVSKATGRLTLEGVNPMAVAKVLGYVGEAFTPATPGNAAFTIEATEKGGLQSTRITLSDIAGTAKFWGRQIEVSKLNADAVYDPATRKVNLEALDVVSDLATGRFKGTADLAKLMSGDVVSPIPVHVIGSDFTLGLQPTFETPWPFSTADVTGTVSPDLQRVAITGATAVSEGMTATGTGEFWMDGPADKRRIGVKVNALADGVITPQQVVMFWPQHLGAGARKWVHDRIPEAKASKAVFRMDMAPGTMDAGFLPDEALQLDFDVRDGVVKFLDDFPAVSGVAGKGRLRGNSIMMDATAGSLNGWAVDEAHINIPRFAGGTNMDITIMGQGQLGPLMKVLDQSNLKVGSRYNLPVDQMAGAGGLELRLQIPTREAVNAKTLRYSIKGGFRDSSAPDLAGGFGLTDSDVLFELSQDSMKISGAGQFGPAPVVFEWNERFTEGKGVALTANAKVTPDLLNAFGIAARGYMQGSAAVDLRAVGPGGRDFSSIRADVDFTPAQLEIPEFGWRKKYDAAAKGSFIYTKDAQGIAAMQGDVKADGLELAGQAKMDAAGVLQSASIDRIFSRDSVDLKGGITQRNDGGYRIALSGPFFDASPWMDQILNMGGSEPDKDMHGEQVNLTAETGADHGPIFEINLDAAKLRLRDNAEMAAAKVDLVVDSEGPRNGVISGDLGQGKKLNVALTTVDEKLKVAIKSDDAGFGARVLLKGDWLSGGKLNVDGTFGKDGGDVMVTMNDVRLKNAPAAAQLFALASLQGLADVLNGDGIMFTSVEAPLKMHDKRVDIVGVRASGPAMGFTSRGWFVPSTSDISLDGVLVPSFGVNSLLGGLPIIGDLFVSRQGEGVFATTYSARGSLYKMRINANPLAMVAPGVLRRIFENPAEPPPENIGAPADSAPIAQNQPKDQGGRRTSRNNKQ